MLKEIKARKSFACYVCLPENPRTKRFRTQKVSLPSLVGIIKFLQKLEQCWWKERNVNEKSWSRKVTRTGNLISHNAWESNDSASLILMPRLSAKLNSILIRNERLEPRGKVVRCFGVVMQQMPVSSLPFPPSTFSASPADTGGEIENGFVMFKYAG